MKISVLGWYLLPIAVLNCKLYEKSLEKISLRNQNFGKQ